MAEPTGGNPFNEGLDAYDHQVPRKKCPYPEGSDEREVWLEGWDSQAPMPGEDPEDDDAARS